MSPTAGSAHKHVTMILTTLHFPHCPHSREGGTGQPTSGGNEGVRCDWVWGNLCVCVCVWGGGGGGGGVVKGWSRRHFPCCLRFVVGLILGFLLWAACATATALMRAVVVCIVFFLRPQTPTCWVNRTTYNVMLGRRLYLKSKHNPWNLGEPYIKQHSVLISL